VSKQGPIIVTFLLLFSLSVRAAEYGELYLSKGVLAYNKKEYEEALEALKQAIEYLPERAEAHYYLGLTQLEMGEYEEALRSLSRSQQLDPTRKGIHFDLGIAYFKLGKYSQALQELEEAERQEPGRALVYYYQGYIHYITKDYHQVPRFFSKAGQLDKKLAQGGHFFSGLAYSHLGMFDEAIKEFQTCMALDPESEIGLGARKYLTDLQQRRRQARRWHLFASMSPQYDDNVILQPEDTRVIEKVSRQADTKGIFFLGGEYRLGQWSDWALDVRYTLYQSMHGALEDFDLQDHRVTLSLSHQGQYGDIPYYWLLGYGYTHDLLENNRYLEAHSLDYILSFMYRPYLVTQLQYRMRQKDFHTPIPTTPFNRDAYNHQVAIQQYIFLSPDYRRYLKLGYAYDNDMARGENWDYQGHRATIGFFTPLIWQRCSFMLDFDYYLQEFLHTDTFFHKTRKDKEYSVSIGLRLEIGGGYSLGLKYLNITHDSNLALYDYKRELVFATLELNY